MAAALTVASLPTGWQTEFILHRLDARITAHADCVAVRTDSNPSFYWGNCLVLPKAPADADLAHWLARFQALVADGRPEVRHVAIGVATPRQGLQLPAWQAAGFGLDDTAVLALGRHETLTEARPVRAARWQVRPIDWDRELDTLLDLQCQDCTPFEPAGYRLYRQRQMARIARLAQAGRGQWFGLWCEGTLAAACGLIRDAAQAGALGRFQHVETHPAFRRRGLCTALIHAVTRWGFDHWQLRQAVICADPHDVAVGIYRTLGYHDIGEHWQLQRNAPQDRAPAPAATLTPTPMP